MMIVCVLMQLLHSKSHTPTHSRHTHTAGTRKQVYLGLWRAWWPRQTAAATSTARQRDWSQIKVKIVVVFFLSTAKRIKMKKKKKRKRKTQLKVFCGKAKLKQV